MCIRVILLTATRNFLFIGTQLQTAATFIVSMDKSNPLLTAAVNKTSVKGRIFSGPVLHIHDIHTYILVG